MVDKGETKELGDSWVELKGKSSLKQDLKESRDNDVEKLIAEATSGEESDTPITPNTSSGELQALQSSPLKSSLFASKLQPAVPISVTQTSQQSSRTTTPPPIHLPEAPTPGEPILRTLCVLIPVIVCSHLAFFAIGYYIGRRTVSTVRF